MTREEAIKRLCEMQFYSALKADESAIMAKFWGDSVTAIDVAISALREHEERSKGCEHCLSEINKDMMLAHGFAHCTDCGRRLEEV